MPCLTRVPEIKSIERLSDVESSTEPNKTKNQENEIKTIRKIRNQNESVTKSCILHKYLFSLSAIIFPYLIRNAYFSFTVFHTQKIYHFKPNHNKNGIFLFFDACKF